MIPLEAEVIPLGVFSQENGDYPTRGYLVGECHHTRGQPDQEVSPAMSIRYVPCRCCLASEIVSSRSASRLHCSVGNRGTLSYCFLTAGYVSCPAHLYSEERSRLASAVVSILHCFQFKCYRIRTCHFLAQYANVLEPHGSSKKQKAPVTEFSQQRVGLPLEKPQGIQHGIRLTGRRSRD